MFYGSWQYQEHPRIVGNEIESVEHVWMPKENHNQGFEMVCSLSEMFSNWYKLFTEDEGEMARLRLDTIQEAEFILERIDERWPAETASEKVR